MCLAQFNIEDHQLLLIAQDGVNVEPVNVDTIVIGSGERIDFVINTNNTDVKTYWIQVRGLGECQETEVNQLAKLQYQGSDQQDSDPSDPPTYSDGLTRGIVYIHLFIHNIQLFTIYPSIPAVQSTRRVM